MHFIDSIGDVTYRVSCRRKTNIYLCCQVGEFKVKIKSGQVKVTALRHIDIDNAMNKKLATIK